MGNLAELAEGTGGQLLPPSLDLREPLRRVMEDVQSHYELAYSPANTLTDGSFRKIEVKVARKEPLSSREADILPSPSSTAGTSSLSKSPR